MVIFVLKTFTNQLIMSNYIWKKEKFLAQIFTNYFPWINSESRLLNRQAPGDDNFSESHVVRSARLKGKKCRL